MPRRVVVTGASSGIGRLTAHALSERGHAVALAARSTDSLDCVVEECRQRGRDAVAIPTDVRDRSAVERLAETARERLGGVDAWVNNAAVMAYGTLDRIPAEIQQAVVETNLGGTVNGCRSALHLFGEPRAGVIVNVASLYARMTSPYVSPYVASKYGVLGLTEVLRQEWADEPQLHVCAVLPGSMDTPIFAHAANYSGRPVRPIPPVGDPRRVARAVVGLVERPRRRRTVGSFHHLLSFGHALLPSLYGQLSPKVMARAGLGDGQMIAEDPGTVLEPRPSTNACDGGWRRRSDPVEALGRRLRHIVEPLGRAADRRRGHAVTSSVTGS